MKRQNLLKSMLCLLLGLVCHVAWAEELSLTNSFADATWSNEIGSTISSGWGHKFVTNTTPALTMETTDEDANPMGWSTSNNIRRPWLKAGYIYNLSLPEGYFITGYTLTTQSTSSSYSDRFNYTTASGTEDSEVQTVNVNRTVTVSGLVGRNSISITINGSAGNNSQNYGLLITGLTINYITATKRASHEEFVNGEVYTFVTNRGWMGATESNTNVISTARTSVTPAVDNSMFQWTVYKSNNGNYYLYNIGKQMFMGVQSANNTEIAFVDSPAGKKMTFKKSSSEGYPIMFSTDNAGVVNHSTNHGGGLINWTGGWNKLDDAGSNHQVTLVGALTDDQLKTIADLVEAYDRKLPVTAVVEGLPEGNPNTHYGSVIVTNGSTYFYKVLKDMNDDVVYLYYDGTTEPTISFGREYRGFEFQGFFLGDEKLDDSFTLTADLKERITDETPLVARIRFNGTNDVTLFSDDDLKSYRIPAIATTSTGRIIAVSDYRHNLDDIGRDNHGTGTKRIDLVARTSDDNGKTWSETMTIAAGDNSKTGQYVRAFGDAAIAAVGENIIVMAAAGDVVYIGANAGNPNRMARIFSSDNGATWTHEEITTKMYNAEESLVPSGVAAFFGSGLLAVDTKFVGTPEKPRIYGALLVRTCIDGVYDNYNNFAVYSDDLGKNWAILGGSTTPIAKGDEPKVEILPSGQILLSARRGGGRVFNVFTYGTGESDGVNGVGSWNDSAVNGCDNGGNSTNGEIFCLDAKKADGTAVKLLLQSQPKGNDRKNVTIWYKEISANSTDATSIAANWTEGLQVSTQKSAYSTMTLQEDGKVGFFFEEAPCYGDDHTKGYCMVYAPLSIESITKGNYFSPSTDLTKEQTINVVLTDAQGNEYHEKVTCAVTGVAGALTAKHPFITLGDNADLEYDGTAYTYTNSVTLPFKVSNEETTVWHNIYIPSYTTNRYPVYFYSESNATTVKSKTASADYGSSDYNTQTHADNMSWAIFSVDNSFAFAFKNKLTNKYIKVLEPASNRYENVQYDTRENATAFSIEKNANYRGDYIVKHGTGHLSVYGANDGYLTFYSGNYHWGSTAKFVEAPDFEALIAEVNGVLDMFGDGLGQYSGVSEENLTAVNAAKSEMENAGSVKLNTLTEYQGYTSKTTGGTLNMPKVGQFFRIKGISGNYIDATSIHGNASATTGQMAMKSADACNYNGTIFYLDEEKHLLNYATGTYVKQTREIGTVGDSDKGAWTFTESPRAGKGKYALRCTVGSTNNGQHLHDSEGNRADRCSSNCGKRHDFTLEEVTELPVAINEEVGYATFYSPVELYLSNGRVKAYTGKVDGNVLKLTEQSVVPANTGVILELQEGATVENGYTFLQVKETTVTDLDNDLTGTFAKTYVEEEAYVLSNKNGIGLYKATKNQEGNTSWLNNAFKAYLPAIAVPNGAQAISFDRGEGTTKIENTELKVENSAVIYDLTGRRVEKMDKGIYIVNGKKVVIK